MIEHIIVWFFVVFVHCGFLVYDNLQRQLHILKKEETMGILTNFFFIIF